MSGGMGGCPGGVGGAGKALLHPETNAQVAGHTRAIESSSPKPGGKRRVGQPASSAISPYERTVSSHVCCSPPATTTPAATPEAHAPDPMQVAIVRNASGLSEQLDDVTSSDAVVSPACASSVEACGGDVAFAVAFPRTFAAVLAVAFDALIITSCRKCGFRMPSPVKVTSLPSRIRLRVDMCK